MTPATDEVSRLYAEALLQHLTGAGEEALHRAYEVGRVALGLQLGVVDLVLVHHGALVEVMSRTPVDRRLPLMAPAADFLAECLSPFEMMLRGYQETNARLGASNAELTRAHTALAGAHQALKAEVAERERAEAALVHAQKLQAIGLLAGGVAHHFNNLLSVVLGNLHLARRHLDDGEDVDRFLESAVSGAERGAEVVKQLLTFSRQQVLESRVLDLAQWLPGVKLLLASALRGDIAVEVDVAPDVAPVRIDPGQLELALLNLAVNARDAMPAGGALRVAAANRTVHDDRLDVHGDYVVIEVSDTGEGIDPAIAARVFEPFFTTKARGPGAGLGLSQVHGFLHQSGGAIDLESVVGQGTTFRLYLPQAAEDAPETGRAAAKARALDASGRVLVVDDDVEVADLAGELLAACGFTVKLAHHASAALDALDAGEAVDLVFSDVIMPGGMSGVELALEIRRRFPKLPILLTTGYSEAISRASRANLPLLPKPYDADALCERVSELIGSGRR